jgi:hypothetical protein
MDTLGTHPVVVTVNVSSLGSVERAIIIAVEHLSGRA